MSVAFELPPPATPSRRWLAALELTARLENEPQRLLADVISDWAEKQPKAPALITAEKTLTYAELSARVNAYAHWAIAEGIDRYQRVAFVAGPSADYVAAWIGLTLTGAQVALVNTSLMGEALGHALDVAKAQHVIVTQEFSAATNSALRSRGLKPKLWQQGDTGPQGLETALAKASTKPLAQRERPAVGLSNPALLIYTSGTTGLPKAANVSHHRVMSWGHWFAGLSSATPQDRLYNCLPLFHSVGGVVAVASMLVAGGSVVIAGKFSVRRFWPDIVTYDCTIFQYIGELCRYLLAAPPGPAERRHKLRLAMGNGLGGDIWKQFETRFKIPQILEFYAATEGSFSLFNVEGKPGSIGKIPSFLMHRFPAAIVKFDVETGLPYRDADGLCVKVKTGEAGEALGRISGAAGGRFEGYTSAAESEKKVLRDVLEKGDGWFRTGDLMRQDAQGYWYFVDRIGDTFRWKGENVSTAEVAAALSSASGVTEAIVYGVAIPGHDGRAGMAALVTTEKFNLAAFYQHTQSALPAYARPLFIRLCRELDATATFKPQKAALAKEGFDLASSKEQVFVLDAAAATYVPLTKERLAEIKSGAARF